MTYIHQGETLANNLVDIWQTGSEKRGVVWETCTNGYSEVPKALIRTEIVTRLNANENA